MPLKSYKLGPGVLEIGDGVEIDISCQLSACRVNPTENVTTEAAIPVLCGEELPEDETVSYAFRLAGTLVQDISAGGVVDYSWANKGLEKSFRFVPSNTEGREVTGTVRIAPISLGGDVKKVNTSDFDWRCIGDPDLGNVV